MSLFFILAAGGALVGRLVDRLAASQPRSSDVS
jgi:hypothetical protein